MGENEDSGGPIPVTSLENEIERLPRLMARLFAERRSRWRKDDPLDREYERWRILFGRIEDIGADPTDANLVALADYIRGERLLEGDLSQAAGLAIQVTACRAMAEALFLNARAPADLEFGDTLLHVFTMADWERHYFLGIRELRDPEGDVEVALEAVQDALDAASEAKCDRPILTDLRNLCRILERHAGAAGDPFTLGPGQVRDLEDLCDPLTAEDMAPILRISERRVRRLLTEGQIPSTLQGRERFTRKKDFIALFERDRPGRRRRR